MTHPEHSWHEALERARLGDPDAARAARESAPPSPLTDYFYARALAEAPALVDGQYGEAAAILRGLVASQPGNPVRRQALALALARCPDEASRRDAAQIWQCHGLPHDIDLLAQAALTLEDQLRPLPEHVEPDLPWPEWMEPPCKCVNLTRPVASIVSESGPAPAEEPAEAPPPETEGTELKEPERPGVAGRQMRRLEKMYLAHRSREMVQAINDLLLAGHESAELHGLAGFGWDELGDARRARAHLARAVALEPGLLLARSHLARVYWRMDWLDLALALARSLPVEGPYDSGRHYHLALIHEARGDRRAALAAMRVALTDFFYDTRHFYIKRALERWLARYGGSAPSGT